MSCLVTMAVMTNDEDVSQLINTINEMTVLKKYLIIFMDTLNTTLLQKSAINFNLLMYHKNAGGEWIATSFCPALGKMYALEHPDRCPAYLQEPHGKTLNVSFIGHPPFITYNPVGGSDLIVTNLLAKKFHFIPHYLPARLQDQ